jgi:hypothetical protein
MKSFLPRVALTCLTLGVCSAGFSQDPVPIEFYRPLKNSVSIGVRRIGGDAKVKFSNIGSISSLTIPSLDGTGNRVYDNGVIGADALGVGGSRPAEMNNVDTNGDGVFDAYRSVVTSTSDTNIRTTTTITRLDMGGGRYQERQTVMIENVGTTGSPTTISNTETILGEYLAYQDGVTRLWSYNSVDQTNPTNGTVDMSIYSVAPSGAVAEAESDGSSGVELQFARVIKRYKRFEWGINFSAGSANINAKTRQRIRANLITTTDRYTLEPGSEFVDYGDFNSTTNFDTKVETRAELDADGNPITYEYLSERNHRLGRSVDRIANGVVTSDGADVDGYWQIKGAYYMLRLGPVIRMPITQKWTASVSFGGALAYVGSRFLVDEYIEKPGVIGPIRFQGEGSEKALVGGYYGDINLERWMTVRTGFFAGYSIEKMGNYVHKFAGRSADVDIGSSGGFRFGIITRF